MGCWDQQPNHQTSSGVKSLLELKTGTVCSRATFAYSIIKVICMSKAQQCFQVDSIFDFY